MKIIQNFKHILIINNILLLWTLSDLCRSKSGIKILNTCEEIYAKIKYLKNFGVKKIISPLELLNSILLKTNEQIKDNYNYLCENKNMIFYSNFKSTQGQLSSKDSV
ncbi:hypothetical protein BpHYR1_054302 [Brachionus plicatilis]|uniref:Uncharacterized protein n=1 Tax=Brachionus plicatilis TaxID=10195 RepID=A0A3M7QU09_BRAPC|nr:hypothetical protein BpHYR1_054302 [Brachionus plicatilis]